jgi:FtsP/CotA-like multicopper oxidase with cupredoxin domain
MTRWPTLAMLLWATAASAAEQSFTIDIEQGKVAAAMRTLRVHQGDVVTLRWRSDRPLTLHLHGYDIVWRLSAGRVDESSFTAFATGRFPIETHGAQGQNDTLAYLEVLPN